jgi:hypothetical protein
VIVRILIWGLFDSKTTIEELRDTLDELEEPSTWIWNEASDRFGIVAFGDDLPEAVVGARDLIGGEAEVFEEFDALVLD